MENKYTLHSVSKDSFSFKTGDIEIITTECYTISRSKWYAFTNEYVVVKETLKSRFEYTSNPEAFSLLKSEIKEWFGNQVLEMLEAWENT